MVGRPVLRAFRIELVSAGMRCTPLSVPLRRPPRGVRHDGHQHVGGQCSVLLFCPAFGLSYEVFLISRIRESWLATGKTRADNDESVALGLARTSRVVTAAALLMAVTFASLVAADVSVMRIFGVGVPLAVLVDATLVRMLLMPAFMRVLGRGELVGACTAGAAAPAVRHPRIFCLGRGFTSKPDCRRTNRQSRVPDSGPLPAPFAPPNQQSVYELQRFPHDPRLHQQPADQRRRWKPVCRSLERRVTAPRPNRTVASAVFDRRLVPHKGARRSGDAMVQRAKRLARISTNLDHRMTRCTSCSGRGRR